MSAIEDKLLGKTILLLAPHQFAGDKAIIQKVLYNGAIVQHIKSGAELFIDEHEEMFLIENTHTIKTNPSLN